MNHHFPMEMPWLPPDTRLEAAGSQELGAGRHAMVPRMKQPGDDESGIVSTYEHAVYVYLYIYIYIYIYMYVYIYVRIHT